MKWSWVRTLVHRVYRHVLLAVLAASCLLLAVVLVRGSLFPTPLVEEGFTDSCFPKERQEERDAVALGAFIPDSQEDPLKIDQFSRTVGGEPAIVMWFEGWAGSGEFDPADLDAVASRGMMPLVTWEPWRPGAGPRQPAYSLQAIASGRHDAYVRRWARGAAAWDKPFYLRFAHEMNGDWYPWGAGVNGNSPAEYVEAWRHVRDIFRQEGANKVRWVWTVDATRPFDRALYPGDAHVEWVALDGYNFGSLQPWRSEWTEFEEIFGPAYEDLAATTDKPMMITETASAETGGDKGSWIRQAFQEDVPERFPKVQAVIWFHNFKERDWRIDSSPGSLAAYKQAVASPTYGGKLC